MKKISGILPNWWTRRQRATRLLISQTCIEIETHPGDRSILRRIRILTLCNGLSQPDRKAATSSLRDPHFFPHAAFFFPVVKRLAVDFVNGSFCDLHAARLCGHEEINVIDCAAGAFHIDTGEIFAAAKTREPIVMDLDQVEREIFASIVDMKLLVAGFPAVTLDVFFDPGRDIGLAHFHCRRSTLRGSGCYLWQLLEVWLRMFCSECPHSGR